MCKLIDHILCLCETGSTMDPPLACIDPNLLQLNQLFEGVDEAVILVAPSTISHKVQEDRGPHTDNYNIFQDTSSPDESSCLSQIRKSTELCSPTNVQIPFSSKNLLLSSLREAESVITQTGQSQGVSFRKRKAPKNFGNTG